MCRNYPLIIFDWDGTLADSTDEWVGAVQQVIQGIGLPERTPAQMRALVGLGVRDILARLFPEMDASRLRGHLRRYYERHGPPRPQPRLFDGVATTLQALKEQGHTLAVATGKSRRGLTQALDITGCRGLFAVTRCADESAPKPAPAMIEDILLRTATTPEAALVVGDTEYDMAMARAADVTGVGVCGGVHESRRLRAAGAIAVLENVNSLPGWLGDRRQA